MENNKLMVIDFTPDKIDLVKRTIAKGATNDELQMFIAVAQKTGLDPFARQIYAVKRWDGKEGREVMSIQVSIDGFRLVAQRSGEYQGQTAPQWCGQDGVWKDLWNLETPPYASRVGVWRKDFKEPCYGVAKWDSYKQIYKDKNQNWVLSPMWKKMGEVMLAKCAESLALRKAFPQELSGLYTQEEMGQADNEKQATGEHETVKPSQTSTEQEKAPQNANGKEQEPTNTVFNLDIGADKVINFGKNKGKTFKELSNKYLIWLLDKVTTPEDLVFILKPRLAKEWVEQTVRLKMTDVDIEYVVGKYSSGHDKFSEMTEKEQFEAIEFLKKETRHES